MYPLQENGFHMSVSLPEVDYSSSSARKNVPRMFDNPSHFLRRTLACSDDQVTLVLPVLIVHYDERFAGGKRGDGVVDWIECE